ncbi:MAG: ATP-binding cassette domain-containing protein [Burkholderiales bacterium]
MATVSFREVTKRFSDGSEALRGISLDIAAGELLVVTGPSGAGKSTLLRLIAAIDRASSGSVVVNGEDITRLGTRAIPYLRRNLGLVFQDQKLLFDRSVYDNVMLPLTVTGHPAREAAKRVRVALDKVGLLARERANPIQLSGGEQQRLAIARAVVNRPSLIVADEPTSNLDAAAAAEIGEIFRSFNDIGITVVIATHDPMIATQYAKRAVALTAGRLAS